VVWVWLGLVNTIKQTGIPYLVKEKTFWTTDASDSNSHPAGDVLSWVRWVLEVSAEFWALEWADVWTIECSCWCPCFSANTVIRFGVQALVASFTEFQGEWEASLAGS